MTRLTHIPTLTTLLILIAAATGLCENGQAIYDKHQQLQNRAETALSNTVFTQTLKAEGAVTETTVYVKGKKNRIESVIKESANPIMGKPGDKTIIIDDGVTATIFSPQLGQMSHPSDTGKDEEKVPQSVTYVGKESVEGVPCHKLTVTDMYGATSTLWISTKESLLIKETSSDGDAPLTTINSDFKPVKGYPMPHTTRTWEGDRLTGTATITRVKTDAALSDSLFDPKKVTGYKKSAPGPSSQITNPMDMMGQMMQMGMEIERLNKEGKTKEAKALEKKMEAMTSGMGAEHP